MKSPQAIVEQMYAGDAFSKWLGIEVLSNEAGCCRLTMTVRKEMCNGFGIAHGGISYSLADSALAFAANGFGKHALSIETGISHHQPIAAKTEIFAEATAIKEGRTLGVYQVLVTNKKGDLLASFKGTVLRKENTW